MESWLHWVRAGTGVWEQGQQGRDPKISLGPHFQNHGEKREGKWTTYRPSWGIHLGPTPRMIPGVALGDGTVTGWAYSEGATCDLDMENWPQSLLLRIP